ncbi:MAG: hypothetical protein AAGN46_09775 [Acidobacteriota bacterium]
MSEPLKRVAILVIASTRSPLYRHYIETFWTRLIRRTNAEFAHVGVFLLFEHDADIDGLEPLANNIIQDPTSDVDRVCPPEHQTLIVPGILLKTIYALELLQNRYDVFFRTNLSSMLKLSAFDRFVQGHDLRYSSAFVWVDALRQQLEHIGQIGPGRSVESLEELKGYEGNSFASGSGYFLNQAEAKLLIDQKDRIRFDLVDDVSIGLMFPSCDVLPGFAHIARREQSMAERHADILENRAVHVRLQHLELDQAVALWNALGDHELWN